MYSPPPASTVTESIPSVEIDQALHLAKPHLCELRDASAIPLPVIAERGYRTVTDATELLKFGFSESQCRKVDHGGYAIPLRGVDGRNGRFLFKPDGGWVDKDGKRRKYMFPAGFGHMLDVPTRCLDCLLNPSVPLFITEGAKKADYLAGRGHCVINLTGVSAWYTNPEHGGFETIQALPDWQPILATLDGRIVKVVFDSDAWSKASVSRELRRLCNWLARQGALVHVVHLPDGPDGSKLGVDDAAALLGDAAVDQLIDDAEPWAWGSDKTIRQLHAENRELRRQLLALERLRRNPTIASADLRVGWAVADELRVARRTVKEGPVEINLNALATQAGVSSSTVGSTLKRIAAAQDSPIVKACKWRTGPGGEPRKVLLLDTRQPQVTAADLLESFNAGGVPEKKPHGGKRTPRCPDHPDAELVRREVLLHFDCGCVVVDEGDAPKYEGVEDLDEPVNEQDAYLVADDDGPLGQDGVNGQDADLLGGNVGSRAATPDPARVNEQDARVLPSGVLTHSPSLSNNHEQVAVLVPPALPGAGWDEAEAEALGNKARKWIDRNCPDLEPEEGIEQRISDACQAQDLEALRQALHDYMEYAHGVVRARRERSPREAVA